MPRLRILVPLLALGALSTVSAQASTLSPRVRWTLRALTPSRLDAPLPRILAGAVVPSGSAPGVTELSIKLLVTTDRPEALAQHGFTTHCVAGDVATMTVPRSRIEELAALPGVRRVELALPVTPLLDVSRPAVQADDLHGSSAPPYPPAGVTGKGVVIGIIDSGIDTHHDDFRKADDTTRLLALWDQTDQGGPSPSPYGYGTVWSPAAISANQTREQDIIGHGTHVAGIAAGNGRSASANRYAGIAPEADLVIVRAIFDDASIVDAVAWIRSVAGSRPSVINLSLGAQFGPHDGTVDMDRALRALTGPGKIIVAATGNDGDTGLHAEAVVPAGGSVSVRFRVENYSPSPGARDDVIAVEAWTASPSLATRVTTPGGTNIGPVSGNSRSEALTNDGYVQLEQEVYVGNGERFIHMDTWDQDQNRPPGEGTWTITFTNGGGAEAEVDLYFPARQIGDGPETVRWLDHADGEESVSYPASGDSVIAVTSYCTKNTWQGLSGGSFMYSDPNVPVGSLSPFSSRGPRRDGVQKPEVAAPGQGIVAARSTDATGSFASSVYVQPGSLYVLSQGTSQAAPHVTGAVALLLQEHPRASVREVVARLVQTARTDSWTGAVPNPAWGYGKLDAATAVRTETLVFLANLSAIIELGEPVIRWTLSRESPGTSFVVERGPDSEGPWSGVSGPIDAGAASAFSYNDTDPDSTEIWYRVRATTPSGGVEIFGPVELRPLADSPRLWQNFPNPFDATTTLAYDLERNQDVVIEIFDLGGRLVRSLFSGTQGVGRHEASWDGLDNAGRPLAAGIYFGRLSTPGGVDARRMTLVR